MMQDMEDGLSAKTRAVEEQELEELRSTFGTEGIQQLQDFEAALKQRDSIITQLTSNLQQAREEKDEIMREFLALTEQSQKLQIQFQQLQAGETLRNTSHSSTAADLVLARQQLVQSQHQLEEMNIETIDEKDMQQSNEKDLIIAEQQRIISERNSSLMHFKDEMENSKTCLQDFQARIVEKEAELKKYADNLESTKAELELCKTEMESYKFQLEKEQMEFLSCKEELSSSRQKEQMSSHEIMQLMGTVEDLQRRCHQGSLSESDTIQKMQEDTVRKLELLRAELDEMYGQQIVQMKQELNLQHAAMLQQMTEKHHAELELLKEQQTAQSSSVSTAEIETLHITIRGLQQTLEQSQTMQTEAKHELTQAIQEKLNLQARVDDLLLELHSAEDKVEQVSLCLVSQESNENELQHLRETIDNLRRDLSSAQQAATDEETKHESEVTNYKIKLEMLEREKDAVLDRMAESQEAELDRLRTQLLFSHEEELSNLRDELLRESFLNRENLLNEATVKQEKVLNELRLGFEEELRLLRNEKASSATERDELLHQIVELKEDLNLALHSSKADELVQQLQELQLELEELRKEGEERARMENELTLLRKNTEMLENQTKEKQHCWEDQLKEHELEKETLQMTKNTLNEELRFKLKAIETLTAENNQMQQQVAQLQKEVEMQRTTFSFAEKNFEVNYQQLKEEYTCLIEAKKMLEEKTLKTTLDFEAEVSSLKSQVCELEETCREFTDGKAVVEKGSTELMEKLNVSLREKESLEGKLSAVTEQLMFTESKVGQLDAELTNVRQEYTKAKSQSQMLEKELEKQQEIISEQMRGHNAKRKTNPKVREQDVENLLRKANKKLSEVLVEVLKTTAAAEETMSLHMQTLRESSAATQPLDSSCTLQRVDIEAGRVHTADDSTETFPGSEMSAEDVSFWSEGSEADGRLELSQQMMDSLLLGAGPQLLNEECLMSVGSRLQTALEKMLMAITDSTNQLEHARVTQTELMRESFRHNQEISELLQKQEELQERLTEEARAREQLALELHHAEGVIDGYTGERTALEEQLRQKGELQLSLEQELQVTSSRLQELEQDRLQIMEERELLSRQQDAMREHAGPRELHLLEETEKLMKEKVEVQRQAEKENTDLLKQVKLLEVDLEEQVNRVIELEFARTTETRDLRQQIQALEKQLEKNRKFLDEQAVDREHERDFFQQEIQKLEQQLKNSQKLQPGSEQRNKEVDQLTSQLKEKADWCSELLLGSEQLRRELGERNEEIDKLESRIRELEQALLASAESLEKVRLKEEEERGEATHSTLQAQLQTEREALERKEKEICNLEEQLEQFKEELENKSEEVQQLHMQLEIQRKEISSQQQYMETRESLFQELDEKDELIKDLESQVECLRSEQDRLKRNNHEELDQLNAVIEKLQQELANIEQNHAPEEDEDTKGEIEIAVCKDEYDEMKQRMDLTVNELETLKTEHSELFETYLCLREHKETVDEAGEQQQNLESELQEALREKTAGLVVMQAQVQALEKSAASRVKQLDVRIMELEDTVSERDSEITRCRLLVEQTQSDADRLQQRVFNLEENVRERMAAAIVSQATLQAFQQQQQPSGMNREPQEHTELQRSEFRDFSVPQMDSSRLSQTQQAPAAKMSHLTQKLRELETGLSAMQKDQELQQQLLTSSEEEVLEYERRLEVLMDLLNQMKTRTLRRTPSPVEVTDEDRADNAELLQELEKVKNSTASTKEELQSYRQRHENLQEELLISEASVIKLREELQEVSNIFETTKEELRSYKQHNDKLHRELQEAQRAVMKVSKDAQQQHGAVVSDSFTQTEPLQMSDLGWESKPASDEEVQQVIGEFQERIEQMQELHAAEILDMEARHISESENLRRDTQVLQDECKTLKAVIDKLRSPEVSMVSLVHYFTFAAFSSDYSQRTGYDLPSLQQEFRTTPEGARRETDDALPDRIKTLLREVHQEGMQVLSLSELPLTEGELGGQFNAQSFAKERDALLANVESLKYLISQMQTHRDAQTSGSTDWRGELLNAVRLVFLSERSVLKSGLSSQLELLDTSDAIIHLNQLERKLAEEAMDSLHTAERSSLISEIHHLQEKIKQLNQGKPGVQPVLSLAGKCSIKEERESDVATNADRLLVDELKVELSQTKLELETTLKAQHKHLKELDALRLDVSQRAVEVDALTDQLTEERKTSRDLQWAAEKDRCRTGRTEESRREELEDLHLTLDEQKTRMSQLTQSLELERQAASQASQQAEQERLGLCTRLQELQVQLESERAKALETNAALGRERALRVVDSAGGELSCEAQEDEGSLLQRLQKDLDDKHAQVGLFVSLFFPSAFLLAGGSFSSSTSSNTLTERLLRQNAELTGFVSRLTEEKNDLRNHTLRLEEELRRYRQAGAGSGHSVRASKTDSASLLLSQERETWTREKVDLEKALQMSQAQVARLKGEIRSDNLREITGPEADNSALKRMYGRYLRSESFRKALIYQKKYLLLLLGGFQECEEATLALLTRMGSRPTISSLESLSHRHRGLMRFRSAVRVSIALSRMRFLVKRWHKATGMSPTSCTVNRNRMGQILGTEARDSPYLHPGSVELYKDRANRCDYFCVVFTVNVCLLCRFHVPGDHGALTCSHLQNYDPDRALSDYISRLEALQRRLGNVTSGASSNTHLHFGLRR
uniref:A-kinase anchoring protein 9 n=1 Tax=Gouania willdenowi TaxID=441366 RepID=A0A8C5DHT2_GOUWI